MAILRAKVWDTQGNKAEIEVTEFKSLKDAYKEIEKLTQIIKELKLEIEKIKDGRRNS